MGVAFFIVPERDVAGLDVFVNGKALAHCDRLDELMAQAGVRPLMEFFSQDPAEAAAFCEAEGVELPEDGFPPVDWYSADDGLATVRGLLAYLDANPSALADAENVVGDLREYETVLSALAAEGVRWHLAVDF